MGFPANCSALVGMKFFLDASWTTTKASILSLRIVEVLEVRGTLAVVKDVATMRGPNAQVLPILHASNVISLLQIDQLLNARPLGVDVDIDEHLSIWRELNLQGVVNARAREALIGALAETLPILGYRVVSSVAELIETDEKPSPEWRTILRSVLEQVVNNAEHPIWQSMNNADPTVPASQAQRRAAGAWTDT